MAKHKITVQTTRFSKALAELHRLWLKKKPHKHAQLQGLILGYLILNPNFAANDGLRQVLAHVGYRGIQGIDGILLTCMSSARLRNASLYGEAVATLDTLRGLRKEIPVNRDFFFSVADLSKIGVGGRFSVSGIDLFSGTITLSNFEDVSRNAFLDPGRGKDVSDPFSVDPRTDFDMQLRQILSGFDKPDKIPDRGRGEISSDIGASRTSSSSVQPGAYAAAAAVGMVVAIAVIAGGAAVGGMPIVGSVVGGIVGADLGEQLGGESGTTAGRTVGTVLGGPPIGAIVGAMAAVPVALAVSGAVAANVYTALTQPVTAGATTPSPPPTSPAATSPPTTSPPPVPPASPPATSPPPTSPPSPPPTTSGGEGDGDDDDDPNTFGSTQAGGQTVYMDPDVVGGGSGAEVLFKTPGGAVMAMFGFRIKEGRLVLPKDTNTTPVGFETFSPDVSQFHLPVLTDTPHPDETWLPLTIRDIDDINRSRGSNTNFGPKPGIRP